MLILTRRVGETVAIGEEIKITLLDVKGQQVRIGIDAPDSVRIHRDEVYDRIKRESRQASRALSEEVVDDVDQLLRQQSGQRSKS